MVTNAFRLWQHLTDRFEIIQDHAQLVRDVVHLRQVRARAVLPEETGIVFPFRDGLMTGQAKKGKLARLRLPPGVLRQRIGQRGRDETPPPRYADSLAPGYRRGRPLRLRAGGLQRLATLAAP